MTLSAEKRLKSAAVALALGGLLVAAAGFCYLRFTPKIFQAAAKIRVWQTGRYDTNNPHVSFDADLLVHSEMQIIRSNTILDRAIQNLGESWNQPGGRDRLRLVTEARQLPGSGVIQISATGADPVQIAAIANEIARAYLDYRQTGREETTHESVDALKAKLAELNPKILQAWTNLARACQNFAPSDNSLVLYDPASFELLQSNRAKMELDITMQERQLAQLKSMAPENLRQALSVFNGRTNALLVTNLVMLNRSEAEFAAVRAQNGPDSVAVQQAASVVDQMRTNTDRAAAAALTSMTMELGSLRASLAIMDQKLANATTNKATVIAAHPELAAPAKELKNLEQERDLLREKIEQVDSAQASLPVTISASLIEPAEPPAVPVSPDARTANAVLLAGGILFAAGLFLRFLMPKPKLVPAKRG
jgi:uncharacterized protein involved in exopolysaccharide biosynthesis